jgi:YidC/Oxa1 family membrane protein insertase
MSNVLKHWAAGCFPTLATIPIFWGLFRSLTDAASSGTLSEGFYFIPSLSGPVSAAQRASGAPTLFPTPITLFLLPPRLLTFAPTQVTNVTHLSLF